MMLEIEYPLDHRAPEYRFISMVLTTLDNGQLAALSLRVGRDELVDSELDKRGICVPKRFKLGNYKFEDRLDTLLELITWEQMEPFMLSEHPLPKKAYAAFYFKCSEAFPHRYPPGFMRGGSIEEWTFND